MKKSIIKNIIICVISILVTLLVLVFLNQLFMPKYIDENIDGRITPEFYNEKLPVDVLFVGSSTVHYGISPVVMFNEYGFTSFDRSNSSQTANMAKYFISESFRINKPKLVVYDVSFLRLTPNDKDEPSTRKAVDYMHMSLDKLKLVKNEMCEDETFYDYIFPLFRYHSRWNDLKTEDYKYVIRKPQVTSNGFLINTEVNDLDFIPEPEYNVAEGTKLDDGSVEILNNIIKLCKDNDVDLMLIRVPTNNNNWGNSYDEQLTSIAEQNNISYTNFTKDINEIGIDFCTDSFDEGMHLNNAGAEKFSKYLGNIIKNNYELTDRRNDEKFVTVWDKKTEWYENAKANQKENKEIK